jgi:hypothetical protein
MQTPPLNIEIGQKALVTVDQFFLAPDGRYYRGVFGTVKGVRTAEETLGVKPNGRSTNWYLEIGNVTVAGCQVHYAVRTEACNNAPIVEDWTVSSEHGMRIYERPNAVYFADEVPQ